ncbi:MAG TPA: hypothetical protein VIM47_00825 [Dermatophilaceae bacterium]
MMIRRTNGIRVVGTNADLDRALALAQTLLGARRFLTNLPSKVDQFLARRYYQKVFDDMHPEVRIKALNERALALGGPVVEAAHNARVEARLIRAGVAEKQLQNCVRLLGGELEFGAAPGVIDMAIARWQTFCPEIFGHGTG